MTQPTLAQAIEAFGEAKDDVGAFYADPQSSKDERKAASKRAVEARHALLSAIAADRAALADALAGLIQSLDGEPEHLGDRCHVCAARRTARAALAALPQPVGDPT